MGLSSLLLPDKLVDRSKFRDSSTEEISISEEKALAFAKIFGICPDYKEYPKNHEYDETGLATTPFYTSGRMTKEQIFAKMLKEGIVSNSLLGRIKAEILINQIFPVSHSEWYEFRKLKNQNGQTLYELRWENNAPYF